MLNNNKIPSNKYPKKDMRPEKWSRSVNDLDMQKHVLYENNPISSSIIKHNELVLPYRLFLKKQEHEKFIRRSEINIRDKYKIVSTDLKKRLYLKKESNNIKAITDIDQDFYNFASSGGIKKFINSYKTAKILLNSQFRMNIDISLKNDCVLQIENAQRKELKLFHKTEEEVSKQSRQFVDAFISEDYKKSLIDLNKWGVLKTKLKNKDKELEASASQRFSIRSKLIGLEYRYSIQQTYGRFLYYLSPPSWRANHRDFAQSVEIEAKGFDYEISHEGDAFPILFEKLKREVCCRPIKPVLYFKHPKHLFQVLAGIEKQQLYNFAYVTHVSPHIQSLKLSHQSLRDKISVDTLLQENMIEIIEKEIQWYEAKCSLLQSKFFQVLNGLFYQSVGAQDVLKLNVHLEFCFKKVFSETLMNADLMSLAKGLEECFMNYAMKLDVIHNNKVQQAVKENFKQEKNKMRRALIARNELRLFNRLEKELSVAFASIAKEDGIHSLPAYKLSNRKKSTRTTRNKPDIIVSKPRRITETEEEYLKLFTNWTEGEDPGKYLHSFSKDNKV